MEALFSPQYPPQLIVNMSRKTRSYDMGVNTLLTTTDWEAVGSILQGLGTAGGAIAVYAAARFGFSSWRRQKLAERNRDQAEVILHAAYNARRALRYVRSPWMAGYESAAAAEKLTEITPEWRDNAVEEKQKRLITAQAYYTRINNYRDEQLKLEECLPMARALFGEDLEEAIDNLHHQFHIIRTYADSYVDDYNGKDREFTVQIRRALFASGKRKEGEENQVSDAIDRAIKTIEEKCLPYLRLEVA